MLARRYLSLSLLSASFLAGCGSSDSGSSAAPATSAGGQSGSGGAAGMGMSGAGGSTSTGGAGGSDATGGAGGTSAGGSDAAGGTGTSGTGGTGAAAGTGGSGGFKTAKHAAPPVVTKYGGPVLVNPQVVTVTYAGFAYKDQVEAYGDWIVGSDWLTTWGPEYGIGPATHLAKVSLPDAAPAAITDEAFQAFLTAKLADGTLPAPSGNPNDYLYVFYFPKSTKYTQSTGSVSCKAFGGFHNGVALTKYRVAYAVVNDCGGGFPELQITASHEIAEAATDPMFNNNPAYQTAPGLSPFLNIGSEVGDWCEDLPDVAVKDPVSGFYAARIWSNAATKIDADPCIPAAPGPMFNVSPSATNFVGILPGGSVDIKLTGWSTEAIGDWTLKAQTSAYSGFNITTKLSATTINNGQVVTATLTAPASAPKASFGSVSIFSTYMGHTHEWVIGVNTPQLET